MTTNHSSYLGFWSIPCVYTNSSNSHITYILKKFLKKHTKIIGFLWHCQTLTFSKQLLMLGSTLFPPNDAISPNCRGIWRHSCRSIPSCDWSMVPFDPATKPNKSVNFKKYLISRLMSRVNSWYKMQKQSVLLTDKLRKLLIRWVCSKHLKINY